MKHLPDLDDEASEAVFHVKPIMLTVVYDPKCTITELLAQVRSSSIRIPCAISKIKPCS